MTEKQPDRISGCFRILFSYIVCMYILDSSSSPSP